MKVLLSPAKIMKPVEDYGFETTPILFPEKSQEMLTHLESFDYEGLKDMFQVSDKVARPVYEHYQQLKNGKGTALYPAVLAYQGIAYQYMAPQVFTDDMLDWVQDHLRIISGVYGFVRPKDGITTYRLEMHTKVPFSLYDYWKDSIDDVLKEEEVVINLASEEYAKLVRKHRKLIDVRFCVEKDGKLVEKAVYAKMARGAMVRYMAEHNVEDAEGMKGFDDLGFQFNEEASKDNCLVFVADEEALKRKKK